MIWWRLVSIAPAIDDEDADATVVRVVDLLAVTVVVVSKIWWVFIIGGKHVEVEVIVTIGCDDAAVVTVDGDNDKVSSIVVFVEVNLGSNIIWWWLSTVEFDDVDDDEEDSFIVDSWCW